MGEGKKGSAHRSKQGAKAGKKKAQTREGWPISDAGEKRKASKPRNPEGRSRML